MFYSKDKHLRYHRFFVWQIINFRVKQYYLEIPIKDQRDISHLFGDLSQSDKVTLRYINKNVEKQNIKNL